MGSRAVSYAGGMDEITRLRNKKPLSPASMAAELVGESTRLRPLTVSDKKALAVAGAQYLSHGGQMKVPDTDDAAGTYISSALKDHEDGLRLPLAIECHCAVLGPKAFRPEMDTLIVGTTSFLFPGGSIDHCEIGETWIAGSVPESPYLDESRLLMLRHAFDVWGLARVRVNEGGDGSGGQWMTRERLPEAMPTAS